MALPAGTVILDRYVLDEYLGRIDDNDTYVGHHMWIEHHVRLRVQPQTASDEDWLRFKRAARLMAKVRSPHVVSILDYGITDGRPCLVTEQIEGESLRDLLRRDGAMPWPRAVEVARHILDGLKALHDEQVLHRNLTPDNIVVPTDAPDSVKLMDLSLAKSMDVVEQQRGITQVGMKVGTPAYMSPEQNLLAPLDAASDLYATGLILYELLTGHHPDRRPASAQAIQRRAQKAPPPPVPPAEMPPLPSALLLVLRSALDPNPRGRPRTAAELSEQLSEAVDPKQADEITRVLASKGAAKPPRDRGPRRVTSGTPSLRMVDREAWESLVARGRMRTEEHEGGAASPAAPAGRSPQVRLPTAERSRMRTAESRVPTPDRPAAPPRPSSIRVRVASKPTPVLTKAVPQLPEAPTAPQRRMTMRDDAVPQIEPIKPAFRTPPDRDPAARGRPTPHHSAPAAKPAAIDIFATPAAPPRPEAPPPPPAAAPRASVDIFAAAPPTPPHPCAPSEGPDARATAMWTGVALAPDPSPAPSQAPAPEARPAAPEPPEEAEVAPAAEAAAPPADEPQAAPPGEEAKRRKPRRQIRAMVAVALDEAVLARRDVAQYLSTVIDPHGRGYQIGARFWVAMLQARTIHEAERLASWTEVTIADHFDFEAKVAAAVVDDDFQLSMASTDGSAAPPREVLLLLERVAH